MALTDPPYNLRIDGFVGGLGKTKHREFAMASGEMSQNQFTAFLVTVLGHIADFSIDGALVYAFMDWRHSSNSCQPLRLVISPSTTFASGTK